MNETNVLINEKRFDSRTWRSYLRNKRPRPRPHRRCYGIILALALSASTPRRRLLYEYTMTTPGTERQNADTGAR
ncbi:hypothetical protein EVAR_92106_1 [Eumeta japonica]|uniref:Uncharacterized protein n=1 Tax=Eumeta variegata TaxID=151549 RepID=A0A4C1T154_EUMVA|nr:hypothetical protein EVAR_92106_1 [Eumeta japonica]